MPRPIGFGVHCRLMKIGSPLPHKKARIEIIPLIDIMFFLLASFLMASLSMMRLQSVKMDLPTAVTAKRDFKPDILNISVKANGLVYYEKQQVNLEELQKILSDALRKNTNAPVYISGTGKRSMAPSFASWTWCGDRAFKKSPSRFR